MRRNQDITALALTVLLTSGCGYKNLDQSSQLQDLEKRVVELEKKVEELAGSPKMTATATPVSTASPSPDASASPQASESPATNGEALWQTLDLNTLPTPEILKEVASLGFLPKAGIIDQKTFEGELTRGQYIALLVEMNNLLHEPTDQIRLAREGQGQAFEDVPPSHPYYKYIQGMVDAGYVIGFNEKTFQPDKMLTREELVAIAAKRDFDFKDFDVEHNWSYYVSFTDKNDVAPKYREAMARDMSGSGSNLKQAFGEQKLLHPKKNVRAYEAVLSLPGVGSHSLYTYERKVNQAMGKE